MRRLRSLLLVVALVAPLLAIGTGAAGGATPCDASPGTVLVRGRLTDAATGLPLDEVASVEFYEPDGTDIDGGGSDENGRWYGCFPPGDMKIKFVADSYRPEWWDDQPNLAAATVVSVPAAPSDPIVANAALTPKGKVLSGRVTNTAGRARFASVEIWRLTSAGWRPVDGIGNDPATGLWSFRVPHLGRYRISAGVDHHWARWYDNDTRLRFARVVVVTEATTFFSGLDIHVPYCTSPIICVPPGFYS